MSWNVVTASFYGVKYNRAQRFLDRVCRDANVRHFANDKSNLFESQFYEDNKEWFETSPLATKENKYGAFVWKPQFILEAMDQLEEGDKILYIDTLDIFHPDIFKFVDDVMGDDPYLFATAGCRNGNFTKRDCFVYMDCDEEDYWNSSMLEAGFSFWRVCDQAKKVLKEWQKYLFDERINGDVTDFSGKPQIDGFIAVRRDQSVLTNIAIRDGLPVVGYEIREYIECNADYWYERYFTGGVQIYRAIDKFLVQNIDRVDFLKPEPKDSIVLTIHNQENIITRVLRGIEDNTVGEYELIIVFDGCTDNTETVVYDYLNQSSIKNKTYTINTPDVFETKANNAGIKQSVGEYIIIVQDDMIIKEKGWNDRMREPFSDYDDVFAVTARTAHNYTINPNSQHVGMKDNLDNCWCDILQACDQARSNNTSRDTFAVRGTVNRGPLMINHEDLIKMNYFDESYSPQDMDDHDLMFRMRKELGKVCGAYHVDVESAPEWGGTRKENGGPASWLLHAHHKNSKIFYQRNKDYIEQFRIIENRVKD